MQEPDAGLVQQAQQRDSAATDALLAQCYPYFRALGRKFCRPSNPRDAEDLAQEVAAAVWAGLPGYRGSGAFLSWAYRIAQNMAYDSFAKAEPLAAPLTGNEAAEDVVIPADLSPEFRRALSGLPERYRACLWLRCVHGMGEAEIGECLGIEVKAVHQRLWRGRKRLQELLKETGITVGDE